MADFSSLPQSIETSIAVVLSFGENPSTVNPLDFPSAGPAGWPCIEVANTLIVLHLKRDETGNFKVRK